MIRVAGLAADGRFEPENAREETGSIPAEAFWLLDEILAQMGQRNAGYADPDPSRTDYSAGRAHSRRLASEIGCQASSGIARPCSVMSVLASARNACCIP
jgi:hypothetical protein